jgi:hypothetical protein
MAKIRIGSASDGLRLPDGSTNGLRPRFPFLTLELNLSRLMDYVRLAQRGLRAGSMGQGSSELTENLLLDAPCSALFAPPMPKRVWP